jgi:hypothetical protein
MNEMKRYSKRAQRGYDIFKFFTEGEQNYLHQENNSFSTSNERSWGKEGI